MRELFPLCAIPIIMVSAKSREENIVQGLSCGSNDYVCKPFRKLELVARIKTQLKLRLAWRSELEREKSDDLLGKMLPHHVISRLKDQNSLGDWNALAEEHANTTILFSDIVGFTSLAASVPTPVIMQMLNELFTRFDRLTEVHNVYKVETIGDAHVCCAPPRSPQQWPLVAPAAPRVNAPLYRSQFASLTYDLPDAPLTLSDAPLTLSLPSVTWWRRDTALRTRTSRATPLSSARCACSSLRRPWSRQWRR